MYLFVYTNIQKVVFYGFGDRKDTFRLKSIKCDLGLV